MTHEPTAPVADGREYGLIMVGVDGSTSSVDALVWALEEARRRAARVEAVYVYALPSEGVWYDGGHPGLTPPDQASVVDAARDELDRAVARAVGDVHKVPLSTVVVAHSSPARGLANAARHADLLVVGAHHVTGLGRLFGSTTAGVLRHAGCPVVVVPGRQQLESTDANQALIPA